MAEPAVTSYSLVIPVYRNEETLSALLAVAANLSEQLDGALEVVFVVDGSPDRSLPILLDELPRSGLNAKVIEMSRNFGAFAAIRAGLVEASGPYFAVMAADLQEPPELVLDFFRKLAADACDVVIGVREGRDDALHVRASSALFWRSVSTAGAAGHAGGGHRRLRLQSGGARSVGCAVGGALEPRGLLDLDRAPARGGTLSAAAAPARQERVDAAQEACIHVRQLPVVFRSADPPAVWRRDALRLLRRSSTAASSCSLARPDLIHEPGYATTVLLVAGFGALNALGLSVVGAYAWRAFENTKARPLAIVQRRFSFGKGEQR